MTTVRITRDRLRCVHIVGDVAFSGCTDTPAGEITIDFATGKISGDCNDSNAIKAADVLERIARGLRTMHDRLYYAEWRSGGVS